MMSFSFFKSQTSDRKKKSQTSYASANQPKLTNSVAATDKTNLGGYYYFTDGCLHAAISVSTTQADSNTTTLYASFSHNMVLSNPPKTLLRTQQANACAINTSQIGSSDPWDELYADLRRNWKKLLQESIIMQKQDVTTRQ